MDVLELDARHLLEQLRGQVRGGADALRRRVQFAGMRLGIGDEVGDGFHVLQLGRIGQDRVRHLAHDREWNELRRIERQLGIEILVDDERRRR